MLDDRRMSQNNRARGRMKLRDDNTKDPLKCLNMKHYSSVYYFVKGIWTISILTIFDSIILNHFQLLINYNDGNRDSNLCNV